MGYPDAFSSLQRLFEFREQELEKKNITPNSGEITLDARYDVRSSIGKAAILVDKISGHIKAEDFPVFFAEVMDESWLEFSRDDSKSRVRRILLEEWTRIAPRQAMIKAEKYLRIHQFIKGEIYDAWSKNDPEGALEFYFNESNASCQSRHMFLHSIIENWTAAVPDKSWAWLMDFAGNKEEKFWARSAFVSSLANNHPGRVKDYIDKISLTYDEKERLAIAWYNVDRENASAWVKAQSSADLKETIDFMDFRMRASLNLGNIMMELDKIPGYEKMRHVYFLPDEVLVKGAENDRQLIEYFATYHMNDLKLSYPSTMEELVDRNIEDVKAWIKELPAGKMRDNIVDMYVRRDFYPDYEANMKLAESIDQTTARMECVTVLLRRWEYEEPEKAAAWREASGFGQENN